MIYQCQNRQVIRQKKEYFLPPLMSMASTNPNLSLDSTKTRSIDKIEHQYNHFAKTIKSQEKKSALPISTMNSQ